MGANITLSGVPAGSPTKSDSPRAGVDGLLLGAVILQL